MRILVVDDTLSVLKITHDMLSSGGYEEVVCASRGQDAIESVKRQEFDLVLMDVVMEGMSGPQAARTIRHTCPDLPILFMTGFPDQLEALRAETVIEKPFTAVKLLKLVDKILSRRVMKGRASP